MREARQDSYKTWEDMIQPGGDKPEPECIPLTGVQPNQGPLDEAGPQSYADIVTHTGEARGKADTAHHSLEPDAPTLQAASQPDDDVDFEMSVDQTSPEVGNSTD